MIRLAALLCACSLVLAACHGGARALIVRSAAPVVPVCRDGGHAGLPASARICPTAASHVREVSRRVGATRLRPSERLVSRDLRRPERAADSDRQTYIEGYLLRRASLRAPAQPQGAASATSAIAASMLIAPATHHPVPALPFASIEDLRGSVD